MRNSTMVNPKTNSRSGATVRAPPEKISRFITYTVARLNISFNIVIKIAPNTAPDMLPRPPRPHGVRS